MWLHASKCTSPCSKLHTPHRTLNAALAPALSRHVSLQLRQRMHARDPHGGWAHRRRRPRQLNVAARPTQAADLVA